MSVRLTISVPEAARRLGIGRGTAYEAVHRGEIPSIILGRRVLIPIAAFEHLLAETGAGGRGEAGAAAPLPDAGTAEIRQEAAAVAVKCAKARTSQCGPSCFQWRRE